MRPPPLLAEHPRAVQLFLAVLLPGLYGGLTGYLLGVSEATYLVLSIIGILGGVAAGFDHLGAAAGARRGALAGFIFGASILVAHEIHGAEAMAEFPDPPILLLCITTPLAVVFGAVGGRLRQRATRRRIQRHRR